jgi:hemerythrin-like domain-containing protein
MKNPDSRRDFLTIAGAGVLVAACRRSDPSSSAAPSTTTDAGEPEDVSATEDLMREHGVIRRVLIVYREAAARLRAKSLATSLEPLQEAAKLMRDFGENYHEKRLEEGFIFPALRNVGGELAATVTTLVAQHQRGREITDYVLAVAGRPFSAEGAEPLARTLEAFARMNEEHTALEDTIVFPAWKKALTPKERDEMSDRFEDIEHQMLGADGFEAAVARIAAIEKTMGIELAAMTAPPPPKM